MFLSLGSFDHPTAVRRVNLLLLGVSVLLCGLTDFVSGGKDVPLSLWIARGEDVRWKPLMPSQ